MFGARAAESCGINCRFSGVSRRTRRRAAPETRQAAPGSSSSSACCARRVRRLTPCSCGAAPSTTCSTTNVCLPGSPPPNAHLSSPLSHSHSPLRPWSCVVLCARPQSSLYILSDTRYFTLTQRKLVTNAVRNARVLVHTIQRSVPSNSISSTV